MAFAWPHIFAGLSGQIPTGYLDDNYNAAINAVQTAETTSAPDAGNANAYVITLSPAVTTLVGGMQVTVQNIVASNTGASTLNVNGLGALPIQRLNGTALSGGEIIAGATPRFILNAAASAWILLSPTGALLNVQTFVSSGSYTPTPGTRFVIVDACGGGGAGGGIPATGSNQSSAGGGGNSGSWIRWTGTLPSTSITIGSGGVGGSNATGGSGGTTSVGTISAPGGGGGSASTGVSSSGWILIGVPSNPSGLPTTSDGVTLFSTAGSGGQPSFGSSGSVISGSGGSSPFGTGGQSLGTSGSQYLSGGANASGYGAGGSGAAGINAAAAAGGNGSGGIVLIYEYM